MPKWVTVDFWDVLGIDDQPFDLLPSLRVASGLSATDRIKRRTSAYSDYLVEVSDSAEEAYGAAAQIRNEDWPERVRLDTGALRPLGLLANEAIAEEMSFHFDRRLQVLVTQRHRFFRASHLVTLLHDLTGTRFVIQPKLREDAWDRFRKMTRIGKVDIKMSGPIHHPTLSRSIPSMAQLLDETRTGANALQAELILSMGHVRNQSMNTGLLRRVVDHFRRDESADRLVVSGSQGDSASETVDFINDRLIHTDRVEYSEKHLDRAKCRQLIRDAIETHREYLQSLV